MSVIDTLDIQLTELGFPDVLLPEDSAVKPKPSEDLSSPPSLNGTTLAEVSQSEENDPVEGIPQRDEDGPPADEGGPAQVEQDAGNDSDDSEVSEVYEEEELDEEEEDEEDEEELSNDPSHAGDYCCSVCDLQLPSKFKLQDHMNLHTGMRPYCCAECGKRFCQIYNYRVHLRTHAKSKVERHWCRICVTGFGSQERLKSHLEKVHLEDVFYECDLCKRVFTSLEACQSHVQIHKCMVNIMCETCGRNFPSEKSLARHKKKRCNLSFKCTDCSKVFTKKNALLKHSFSHLGMLPYTCIRCRCHFRLAKLYRQHKCEPQRIHCVACLREFLSQEDFQRHKKDTGCWGNQGLYQKTDEIRCLECGQRFDTSDELKKHAGAHQRVLKCAECGKGFRSALLLMSHMGGHAGKSPCLCQSCGLGFPHQQNYDSHLKTCGQTSSASVPKKRQTLKSSQPEKGRKDHSSKPDASNAANTVAVADVLNKPATPAPASDSSSPGLVTEGVPAASGPSEGVWSLTLNDNPPPGTNLVLFLPICPSQTNEPPLSSATLPVGAGHNLLQASPSPVSSSGFFGVNSALQVALSPPLELLTGIKENMPAPLDLSKKSSSFESAVTSTPRPPIKREPEEVEVSGQAYITEAQETKSFDSIKEIIKTDARERDAYSQSKRLKMHPTILSLLNTKTVSPGLTVDVKKEPQSPGPYADALSSRSCQLMDLRLGKKIKMEAEISSSACAEMEK